MRANSTLTKTVLLAISCLILVLFFTGCATTKAVSSSPDWVNKGSGAFDGEMGKVFYGVGVASNIKNKAMLRQTADNRARAEIAKVMNTYVASLAKDYMATTAAGDNVSEEQHIENSLKSFTKATLAGVEIVDHWLDTTDGSMYALSRFDLETFSSKLDKFQELDTKARNYIESNAKKAFDELSQNEAKFK